MAVRFDDVDPVRDRELVERFQAGDQSGFEDLYRRYYGRLYRFCLKRITDPHVAEEVTQESFVRAFRALSNFGGERRFYPWLSVIAARLCIDNYRRSGTVEVARDVDPGTTDGGVEQVIDDVDRELLRRALARLTPRHREVLRLREEERWSYDHIASHMQISLGTVEALLWRARRALRREYLAVVNFDDRMAAVPVLGWLARKLGSLRARAGRAGEQALPALANGAVSITIVVASAAGVGMLSNAPAAVAAAPSATRATGLASATQPAASSTASASRSAVHASASRGTASGAPPTHVRLQTADPSQRQAAEANVETPVAGLDVNPSVVVDGVKQTVTSVKGQS